MPNVKQGGAKTASNKKPGPKPGTKRSPESIAKAAATRKRNAAKKRRQGGATTTTTTRRGRRPNPQTFKLYAVDSNELAYLVDSEGVDGVEAVTAAIARGEVAPGIPIVPLSVSEVKSVTIDAIPQPPLLVVRDAAPAKRRGRPPGSGKTAASSTGAKKRGPKPGYKRTPESIEKAKATRARNAAAKAKAGGAAPKKAGGKKSGAKTAAAPAPAIPTPPPVPAAPGVNPFAE